MTGRRSSGGAIVAPDSVLAATAREIVAWHGAAAGRSSGVCPRCAAAAPCPPVRAAAVVLQAAGLPMPSPGEGVAPAQPSTDDRATDLATQPQAVPHLRPVPARAGAERPAGAAGPRPRQMPAPFGVAVPPAAVASAR